MRAGANGSGAARGRDARPGRYCSTDCQRVDWRDRGHRKACKKIRAEAARDQAPTPPPEVVYGPAPRSHADEVRARIAAEHEAARARREAEPEPLEPYGAAWGSRCPICLEDWDENQGHYFRICCCKLVCRSCEAKIGVDESCPICRTPCLRNKEALALLRRHVENDVPEAIKQLGDIYSKGDCFGIAKNMKKANKLFKRAVELGDSTAMVNLGMSYEFGEGVKLDRNKAKRLYRVAADRGSAHAQKNLGLLLLQDGDYASGFGCMKASAERGFTEAEGLLGVCYLRGDGVEVDINEGQRWLRRAAAKGNEYAIGVLRDLF